MLIRIAFGLASALFGLVLLSLPPSAMAVGVDTPLPDPAQEARARAVSREIRCLVCQNQSIEDSNAPLASDLRLIVRERIQAGDSDDQVRAFLVRRYGDWVLLNPPFNLRTLLLWLLPALLAACAAVGAWVFFRRRQREASLAVPAALSDEERARLDRILGVNERGRE